MPEFTHPLASRAVVAGAVAIGLVAWGLSAPAHAADETVFTPAGTNVTVTSTLESTDISATYSEVPADMETVFNSFPVTDYPAALDLGDVNDFVFTVGASEVLTSTLEVCLTHDQADGNVAVYTQATTDAVWFDVTSGHPSSTVVCGQVTTPDYSGDFLLVYNLPMVIVPQPLPIVTSDYELSLEPIVGPNDYFSSEDALSLHLRIANLSATEQLHIGFGLDLAVEGATEKLWLPSTWGAAGDEFDGLVDIFAQVLEPGEILDGPLPSWPGKTYSFFLLAGPTDVGQLLGSYTADGGFVPIVLDAPNDVIKIGSEAFISGSGPTPELFPGVNATVTASGLTPGDHLEFWLAPGLDYFWFYLIGATLPDDAVNVGSGTVAADGTLSAAFDVPSDTTLGSYQLVIGDVATRYWPAGSYSSFAIGLPEQSDSAPTPTGATDVSLTYASTALDLDFTNVTQAGETTAAVSTTGPISNGFTLTSNPQVYYHIETTATFTGLVEVCVTYDPAQLTGGIPYLYHYTTLGNGSHQWQNITTSRVAGEVCGLTSSFSPFTLGYPVEVVLTSKDQCKSGGWATSTHPVFKNQGACVSSFAGKGK